MVLVATQVKRRRGTTAENDAFTGAEGEIVVDTQRHELRVHDGSTVGGHTIPTKNYGYSKTESDNLLSNKANIALDNLTSAGKEVCANMAMPSSNTQAITVGASGATYTAPADGYVVFTGLATAAGQFVYIGSPTFDNIAFQVSAVGNGEYIIFTIPVNKGQVFTVNYNLGGTKSLNFVYANGAQ